MHSPNRWIAKPHSPTAMRSMLACTAGAALLASAGIAHSGPCTAQIAQLEQQVHGTAAGPNSGPTSSQTLGAQLHYQPTPRDVEHAQSAANKDADAALDDAKKADAAGNAADCDAALTKARHLYGID